MSMRWQVKGALGSALAATGALVIVLSLILGWYGSPNPWLVPLEFAAGVVAGIGAAWAAGSLVARRRRR